MPLMPRSLETKMKKEEEEVKEAKRVVYQRLIAHADDIKRMVNDAMAGYGNRFNFNDAVYRDDVAYAWWDYLDGRITKDDLKFLIRGALAYANVVLPVKETRTDSDTISMATQVVY